MSEDLPASSPGAATDPEPASSAVRLVQVTSILALVGVVLALVGLAISVRPLRTPTQDCGTAFGFLYHGRVDEFVDPADPPRGVTAAEAEDNNATPCQERAANRAVPAATLVVGGTALGVGALLVEWISRIRWHRRARRSWLVDHSQDTPPAPS